MIKAAILAGKHESLTRLVQLLHSHPDVELVAYADNTMSGQHLDDVYPALTGETELVITSDIDLSQVDVVFIADSPGAARRFMASTTLPDDLRVIDMSGDFRDGDDPYGFIQGIPELNRKAMVRGARYVSMPDEATTAIILGLLPLARNLMLNAPITVGYAVSDSASTTETISAAIISDKITNQLVRAITGLQSSFSSKISGFSFTGEMAQGIAAIIEVDTGVDIEALKALFDEFYDDHNFTFLVDSVPDVNDVRGTNKCFVYLDKTGDQLVINTVMDNDLKGGAGNAVHVMNLLFGLIEKVGL
ncbi:MAG: N-acetyl-gamma-glutamyl-phosphate reductase [Muribaculaceae bacterium]|nr:N-acetyl-gamma-glutamyl-phosphate reductase [Muribaculaceae bacterium]